MEITQLVEICALHGESNANRVAKKKKCSTANAVTEVESSDSDYIDTVLLKPETINVVTQESKEIYAQMLIKDRPVRFHVDCGATINVLPIKFITDEVVTPTDRILQMWNKSELKPLGTTRLTIRNPKNRKKYSVEFLVVNEDLTPLLGAKVIQRMGLIEVQNENFEQIATATTNVGTPTATAN